MNEAKTPVPSRLAGASLLLAAASAGLGGIGSGVAALLCLAAWVRCAQKPELRGQALCGSGLVLALTLTALAAMGQRDWAPDAAALTQRLSPISTQTWSGPIPEPEPLDPSMYTAFEDEVRAEGQKAWILGVPLPPRAGLQNLYEQAKAYGADDFINEHQEVKVRSILGLYRVQEIRYRATPIKYNTR